MHEAALHNLSVFQQHCITIQCALQHCNQTPPNLTLPRTALPCLAQGSVALTAESLWACKAELGSEECENQTRLCSVFSKFFLLLFIFLTFFFVLRTWNTRVEIVNRTPCPPRPLNRRQFFSLSLRRILLEMIFFFHSRQSLIPDFYHSSLITTTTTTSSSCSSSSLSQPLHSISVVGRIKERGSSQEREG